MYNKILRALGIAVISLSIALTLFPATSFASDPNRLVIVHTNDMHGRIIADDKMIIGIAKLKTFIDRLKAAESGVLVLDAGDTFHGLPIVTLNQGEGMIPLLNQIGYDAIVPGNHDFNYGINRLQTISNGLDFPMLAANIRRENQDLVFPPYTLKTINGYRIGIFGLATPETAYLTNPDNIKGIIFTDPIAEAKQVVDELKNKRKADLIIAVTHLGLNPTSQVTSLKLADSVPGIDLIVDGHSHTVLPVGQNTKNGAVIVSTGCYNNYYGKVVIQMENRHPASVKAMLYSNLDLQKVPDDSQITADLKKTNADLSKLAKIIIGSTDVELVGVMETVRTQETNLGTLIAEAMCCDGNADVALVNSGSIRASIPAGQISKLDVITVLPFGNLVVTKKINGATLKAALENGFSFYPQPSGRFPQVAGFSYEADFSQPVGSRVVSMEYQGQPLTDDQELVVAVNDFMAAGGDGYTVLADADVVGEFGAMDEALIRYLASKTTNDNTTSGGK